MENTKKDFILFVFLLCPITAVVQKKNTTDIVMGAAGEAVIGTSIVEVGATNGAVSDIGGNFTLSVSDNANIQVSFMGFSPQTLNVKGKTSFRTILKESGRLLQEVAVTGYGGRVSRAKLTNPISTVSSQVLDKDVYINPSQALSGSVPGLRVSLISGNPTSSLKIISRSGAEFDGPGSPLVMASGQLRDNFDDVNPQDIAFVDVLEDAGATTIYGTRASSGVTLIITKSGKAGHREINFRTNIGLGYVNNPYDLLGTEDYTTTLRTAYKNTPWATTANPTGPTAFSTGNKLGANIVWNIMGKTDENAYLLNMG